MSPGDVIRAAAQRGRPRDASRERAICDATVELLLEVGFERMSMDDLAARAHASKATIYRRWPSKTELVLDALRQCKASAFEPVDTGSLRGDLLTNARQMVDSTSRDDAALLAGLLMAMRENPDIARTLQARTMEDKRAVSRSIVARAVERGELPAGADPDLINDVAAPAVLFRFLFMGEAPDEAFLERLVDDVMIPILLHPPVHPVTSRETP